MILPALLATAGLVLPFPPVSTNIVTESSISLPFAPDHEKLPRITLQLALDASPSNNLEIALGEDTNDNGQLDLLEADITFGYDCGSWFLSKTESGLIQSESAPTEDRAERTWEFTKRELSINWNMMRLTRRGTGLTAECAVMTEHHPGILILVK